MSLVSKTWNTKLIDKNFTFYFFLTFYDFSKVALFYNMQWNAENKTAKKNLCISQSIFENDSLLQQTKINHVFSFKKYCILYHLRCLNLTEKMSILVFKISIWFTIWFWQKIVSFQTNWNVRSWGAFFLSLTPKIYVLLGSVCSWTQKGGLLLLPKFYTLSLPPPFRLLSFCSRLWIC